MHSAHLPDTPAGPMTVWVSRSGVRRIEFGTLPREAHTDPPEEWPPLLARAVGEIQEYLRGGRTEFDLPLDLEAATEFQRRTYEELMKVPYGRVTTYGQLAEAVGRDELARAIGQAVGANPVPIIIPCHRVVAAEGRLGGFSGGLPVKVALLGIENVQVDGVSEHSKVHPEVLRLDL